jgi:hypothetical protein
MSTPVRVVVSEDIHDVVLLFVTTALFVGATTVAGGGVDLR